MYTNVHVFIKMISSSLRNELFIKFDFSLVQTCIYNNLLTEVFSFRVIRLNFSREKDDDFVNIELLRYFKRHELFKLHGL